MSSSLPFLSVVVPAHNRPEALAALLEALAEQSYPPYRFEVLVCDDGSTPPLAERVSVKDRPFSVRFLRADNAGPATARNRGLREARGAIIAFTDDDCLPDPDWLEAVAETLGNPAVTAVNGPIHASAPPVAPFFHALQRQQGQGVSGANFAVRKEKLAFVGGFDETFTVPSFEDEDLARRLQAAFGPVSWNAAMRVEHPRQAVSFAQLWREARVYRFLPYMQRQYRGFQPDALAPVRQRCVAKGALALVGLLPLFGAPASLAVAWGGILAWQMKRLQAILKDALAAGVRIPLKDQLQFLCFEWLVDFARWGAYMQGRKVQRKPEPPEELVLE